MSYTLQKQRESEDIIPEDSDSVPPGRDVIFTFANLLDSGPANSFTLKKKGWEPPDLQGDGRDSEDSDPLDNSDFNNNNNDNEVDDHLWHW